MTGMSTSVPAGINDLFPMIIMVLVIILLAFKQCNNPFYIF